MSVRPSLLNLIERSPFRALQKHMGKACDAVDLLIPFFDAMKEGDQHKAEKLLSEIIAKEHAADEAKRKVRMRLHQDLFLPVSRTDLLVLIHTQDKIANQARDLAGLVYGRRMQFTGELSELILVLVAEAVKTCEHARKVVIELGDLIEAGFSGRVIDMMADMIDKLDDLEKSTDEMQVEVRHTLYRVENNYRPVDVVFYYQMISEIGALADHAQDVGARLLLLLAR